jgi:protein-tyrosine sulfotransferase
VIKPVNLEALTKWVGHIPDDVVKEMANIAPMLSTLGYDPYDNNPKYGSADALVKENTFKVREFFFLTMNLKKVQFASFY